MVWKILSVVSAGCLGAACYFAWSNQKDFKQETRRKEAAESNLKAVEKRKAEGDEALTAKQALLATLEKDRNTMKEEVVKLAAEAQEKEAALAVIKGNLDQVTQQVTSLEKKIEEAGDITKLVAQMQSLEKEQQNAAGAVANQAQRLANTKDQIESLTKQVVNVREAAVRASKGIVDPDFTARVAQYFPEWDFAVLNKGNAGGVFANADLEVKRGRNVIARLKVRNVEQGTSVAELVPGSLAAGEAIQTGDMVVAAATQTAAKSDAPKSDTPPAPQTPGATTETPPTPPGDAPAPAMGADPFGAPAPGAPAPAPAMSDPFGAPPAPAPGAAPAPAPAMSDPFGAPPAPAPGAAPAPAPGAAPAPAPGAAPAAPAPGAGTPASPSTADPFAPAPKKP